MLGEQYFRYIYEENNDTKGVIRNHKSKKDWQYNGEKKKKGGKVQTTVYKTLHRKLKIQKHEPYKLTSNISVR
jgi:hypothetical protein